MYEIENDVKIPELTHSRKSKYPFDLMEVGQSFKVEGKNPSSAVSQQNKRNPEKRFIVRREGDDFRVWRVEVEPVQMSLLDL